MNQSPGANQGGQGVAIVDIWTFRTEPSLQPADIVGFSVEATDGSIGKVDEATVDAGQSHLIVDTGPWIFGKNVMLPAGVVDRVDLDAETVYVNRSKDEIKSAPEYEPGSNLDSDYRERLGGYYGDTAR
jgi:PRC-barrel domain